MKKIFIFLFIPISLFSQIGTISNGETGLSTRTKLNQLIDTVNNNVAVKSELPDTVRIYDSLNIKASKQEVVDSIVSALSSIDSLILNSQSTALEWLQWKIFADSAKHTVSIHMDANGVTLQVGMEMYLYARNVSGSTMTNFTPARIVGSTGDWADMDICGIGSPDSAKFAGLATHTIANNEFGFFTTFGSSRDGNSSNLTQGDPVYIGKTGTLMSDTVNYPYEMFQVGYCIRSHATAGEILVIPDRTTLNHITGSVLFTNGNREIASDTSIIKRQNGQILIDSANIDVFTDGSNNYTLAELVSGSGGLTWPQAKDSIITNSFSRLETERSVIKSGTDSIVISNDFGAGTISIQGFSDEVYYTKGISNLMLYMSDAFNQLSSPQAGTIKSNIILKDNIVSFQFDSTVVGGSRLIHLNGFGAHYDNDIDSSQFLDSTLVPKYWVLDKIDNAVGYTLPANVPRDSNAIYNEIAKLTDDTIKWNSDVFIIALSDSSSELSTTVNGFSWDWPYNATIDSVQIGVASPPTGSALSVDIKKNGTTIFSTGLTIDAGDSTSVQATTPYSLSTTSLSWLDRIQAHVTAVGATFGGSGLVLYIYYKREE